jgi:hypothetical protein
MITLALKQAGILGVGQTALAEDINDCFQLLSQMLAQWQVRRWMVPALMDISNVGNNALHNSVGPGGYFNTAVTTGGNSRPNDIKGGYIIQLNTGSNAVSLPLRKIFSFEEYILISVKGLNSLPDHFFYDNRWPLGDVYIWPVPNSSYEIHLLVETPLDFPLPVGGGPGTGLDTPFTLPAEYQEAVFYNLSIRISAMYQFPANPDTMKLAKVALNTIVVANTQVPKLSMPAAVRRGRAFNIFNADSL